MSQSSAPAVEKIVTTQNDPAIPTSSTKISQSTKDSGRVHIGGAMMRFTKDAGRVHVGGAMMRF